MDDDVDFDQFVQAVQEAGLGPTKEGAEVVDESKAIPLTHTSGVTPRDWERVQKALDEQS